MIDDNKVWQGPEFDFYATFPTEWVHTKNSTFFEDTLECINRFVRQGMTTQEMAKRIGMSEVDLLDWYATGLRVALPPPSHHEMTVKLRRWLGAEMAVRDGVQTSVDNQEQTNDTVEKEQMVDNIDSKNAADNNIKKNNEDKIDKNDTSDLATCVDTKEKQNEEGMRAGLKRVCDVDADNVPATKRIHHV
tara:strand:- start:31 stop:600 length:570 start_codon:yes stop_codon:yes gene_type:complete